MAEELALSLSKGTPAAAAQVAIHLRVSDLAVFEWLGDFSPTLKRGAFVVRLETRTGFSFSFGR
jgi:hypothetical protein